MNERRRYKRFHLAGSVKIKRSKGSVDALTLNLSLGGIGVYAKKALKTGEEVIVLIKFLRRGVLKSVEAVPGKVRWVMPIGVEFGVGIKFDKKVGKIDTPLLYECIAYARGGR